MMKRRLGSEDSEEHWHSKGWPGDPKLEGVRSGLFRVAFVWKWKVKAIFELYKTKKAEERREATRQAFAAWRREGPFVSDSVYDPEETPW